MLLAKPVKTTSCPKLHHQLPQHHRPPRCRKRKCHWPRESGGGETKLNCCEDRRRRANSSSPPYPARLRRYWPRRHLSCRYLLAPLPRHRSLGRLKHHQWCWSLYQPLPTWTCLHRLRCRCRQQNQPSRSLLQCHRRRTSLCPRHYRRHRHHQRPQRCYCCRHPLPVLRCHLRHHRRHRWEHRTKLAGTCVDIVENTTIKRISSIAGFVIVNNPIVACFTCSLSAIFVCWMNVEWTVVWKLVWVIVWMYKCITKVNKNIKDKKKSFIILNIRDLWTNILCWCTLVLSRI